MATGKKKQQAALRNIWLWTGMALLLTGILVAQVWKQNMYVNLKRAHSASQARTEQLKSDIAAIQLDNKKLKDYKRLEGLAEKKFE